MKEHITKIQSFKMWRILKIPWSSSKDREGKCAIELRIKIKNIQHLGDIVRGEKYVLRIIKYKKELKKKEV